MAEATMTCPTCKGAGSVPVDEVGAAYGTLRVLRRDRFISTVRAAQLSKLNHRATHNRLNRLLRLGLVDMRRQGWQKFWRRKK